MPSAATDNNETSAPSRCSAAAANSAMSRGVSIRVDPADQAARRREPQIVNAMFGRESGQLGSVGTDQFLAGPNWLLRRRTHSGHRRALVFRVDDELIFDRRRRPGAEMRHQGSLGEIAEVSPSRLPLLARHRAALPAGPIVADQSGRRSPSAALGTTQHRLTGGAAADGVRPHPVSWRYGALGVQELSYPRSKLGRKEARCRMTAINRVEVHTSESTRVDATVREPWLFLLGRPPIEEYLSFRVTAAGTEDPGVVAAADRWRDAASALEALARTEAGAADGAVLRDLPQELRAAASEYLARPEIAATYVLLPPQLMLVPLDQLVVYQRQINMRYAAELRAQIGDWTETSVELLNFCLAIHQPEPPIAAVQAGPNCFVFSSVSTDARFLGARLLDASQVSGLPTGGGRPTAVVALEVGYGANALNVVGVNGRWILNNGSHRAYALRSRGFTHVPAVVQMLTRPDDLTRIPSVQQNAGLYLADPRPPMLPDYFNGAITDVIDQARRLRQVRVQFSAEPLDAPG